MTAIATAQVTMCANQEALAEILPALSACPPIVVDDAPWHRAGSGNLVLNAVLRNGGTLYIDRFGQEENSAREGDNLVLPSSSIHITELMPLFGLITRLEEDVLLRKAFFRNLDLIWIVSGIITDKARYRLQKLALEQTNFEVPILASFTGSGTSAVNTALYFDTDVTSNIGLPLPGTFLKLVKIDGEDDDIFELRVKAPGTQPGIWKDSAVIEAETDEDGFYAVSETVRLIDEKRPFKGIERISRVDGVTKA